eukprot:gnl/Spiro4/22496_TR11099_c0_g1_i1.p1 gnl/Spiro4/22496_TR11099_c0_g1~~gnl/Spiro4/22496_TR11099_c0_g1_i1.p1  ORF type:complete len:156 (-),score=39.45 gnl/Spiro4/22496_TR11099_c0_g1_i1:220-639(-)
MSFALSRRSQVSSVAAEERLVFNVEWLDPQSTLVRKFVLIYYPFNCTLEMIDPKTRKLFLKKTEYPAVQLQDLWIGNTIEIYTRQLLITGTGDGYTENKFRQLEQQLQESEYDMVDDHEQVPQAANGAPAPTAVPKISV